LFERSLISISQTEEDTNPNTIPKFLTISFCYLTASNLLHHRSLLATTLSPLGWKILHWSILLWDRLYRNQTGNCVWVRARAV